MEALLVKNDNWSYVSGEKPCPKTESSAESPAILSTTKAWEDVDCKAKSDLILAINLSELKQVRGCKTSKEVWDKSIYDSKGPARKATLLKHLTEAKIPEGRDVKVHIVQFFDTLTS